MDKLHSVYDSMKTRCGFRSIVGVINLQAQRTQRNLLTNRAATCGSESEGTNMLKKAICILAAGALFFGALAACAVASTPAAPSVSKDTEQMIATAGLSSVGTAGQSLRESLGVPARVEETALPTQIEKCSISISADVTVPDVDHLSVYRVSAADFSQEFAARAFGYFCKDETMYNYGNIHKTKDQIQARIDSIQQDLDHDYSPDGQNGDDSWRAEYEAEIAALKTELQTAREDLGDPIQSVQFSQEEAIGNGVYTEFQAVNAPKYPYSVNLFLTNNVKYQTDAVQYIASSDTTVAPRSEASFRYCDTRRVSNALFRQRDVTNESQIAQLKTTPAQAMKEAASLLDQLGIADLEPYRVFLTLEHREDGAAGKFAYYVEARRIVDGVEVQSPFNRTYVGSMDDGHEWAYETLNVSLDDEGVIGMAWTSPLSVGPVEVERANLLPFSSILTVARNMLGVVNAPLESDLTDYSAYRIEIDRITLSLQRIPDANSVETGLLIPVWNFYGTEHFILPNGIESEQNGEESVDAMEEPYLSINAIDGSVISKTLGY